jgi:hypothetical protein
VNEMAIWDALPEAAQAQVMESGRRLVSWAQRLSSHVYPPPANRLVGARVVCRIELANEHVLDRFDKSILRQLDALQGKGIRLPLLPLYVATWKQAMEGEMSEEEERAVLLLMMRVQGTAQLAINMKADPGNQETVREMRQRGLLN